MVHYNDDTLMGHYLGEIKEAKEAHLDIHVFTDHRQDDLAMALICDTSDVRSSTQCNIIPTSCQCIIP